MITFDITMDPHSLTVRRDGSYIGLLLWHPNREPHFAAVSGENRFTLQELDAISNELRKQVGKPRST